jgi:hypothetical protein
MLDTEFLIALAPLFIQHPHLTFTAFICWCGIRPTVAFCKVLVAWLKRPKPPATVKDARKPAKKSAAKKTYSKKTASKKAAKNSR